jgi:hypothetical protein
MILLCMSEMLNLKSLQRQCQSLGDVPPMAFCGSLLGAEQTVGLGDTFESAKDCVPLVVEMPRIARTPICLAAKGISKQLEPELPDSPASEERLDPFIIRLGASKRPHVPSRGQAGVHNGLDPMADQAFKKLVGASAAVTYGE